MNPYVAFALNSFWEGILGICLFAIVAAGLRWERREMARIDAYRERLGVRDDRRAEDVLWNVFREQEAEHAEELSWQRSVAIVDQAAEAAGLTVIEGAR